MSTSRYTLITAAGRSSTRVTARPWCAMYWWTPPGSTAWACPEPLLGAWFAPRASALLTDSDRTGDSNARLPRYVVGHGERLPCVADAVTVT